ncbi:MAG: hypothetical protein V4620_09560 [Bacteroidota bacterium]
MAQNSAGLTPALFNLKTKAMIDVNKYLDTGAKVASLLGVVFALYIGVKYNGLKEEIATSQAALGLNISQMNKNQDSIDFERKHRFIIYEKVYSAVESKQDAKIDLAAILVTEMLAGDQFQKELLKVLGSLHSSVSPTTQHLINTTIAQLDTAKKYEDERATQIEKYSAAGTNKTSRKSFLIDVFYLESKGDAQKRIAENYEKLLTKNGFDARVRKLSDVVNARKGYKIYTNQIRVESANETEIKLGNEIQNIVKPNTIAVQQVTQSSPGYISLFLVE